MTKKRIFFVLILVMMPILISCSRIPNTEKSSKELEPETSVYKFLEKIDPEVYKNCKVLIGLNSNIFYEGDFAVVKGYVCGNIATFWINQQGNVECYTRYRCEVVGCDNIGKKICIS
ncbi:MAG: hypothetical protein AABX33_08925 [Nanoarchaeota archaeon]